VLTSLSLFVLLAQPPATAPLPEGNAYVRALVSRQRSREEALNRYTYDVEEIEEDIDGKGLVRKTETRRYEVFHVKGRPIRKQVALNGRPLEGAAAQKEERRVKEKVDDILDKRSTRELPEVRLSQVLARYDFQAVGREEVDGRPTLVFTFAPVPGKRDLEADFVLRRLKGRIWVDEEEQELVRAELSNTENIKVAFGLGASVSSLDMTLAFRKVEDGVWLPSRIVFGASGRKLLVMGFRVRTSALYGRYRRFEADTESETLKPPPPP
jgi:hypothetical protein